MKRNTHLLLLLLLTISLSLAAQGQATNEEKYALKARPVPTQCEALRAEDDAAVTQAAKQLASADAAGKIRLLGELAKSCHKKAVEAATQVLPDKDPLVRQAAVEALGQLGDVESIEMLTGLTEDPDWRVRFSLGVALCSFQKAAASVAALNRLMLVTSEGGISEGDLRARLHTGIMINQLRDASFSRKTFNYFLGLMDHENEMVRNMVGEAMQALKGTKNAQYELIGILKQSINPNMRRKAIYWIGQLKIERGRWQVQEAAEEDADESVRKAAVEALKLLGPTDEEPPPSAPKTKAAATGKKAPASAKAAPKTVKKK